jgi:hypothetical protein
MYTSLVLIALSGPVATSSPEETLAWHTSYVQALQVGQTDKKPLAVFFGSGQGGYAQVCRDGQFSSEVRKALGDSYVCCYVDMESEAGKKLAADFAINRASGLVISDRTGNLQAFYHDGNLSTSDLNRWLTRLAEPDVQVRTTLTNDSAQVSMYPSNYSTPAYSGGAGGYQPYYPAPFFGGGG